MPDGDAHKPLPFLARAERLGRLVENAFISVLLAGLIVLASGQIVLRNVFSMGINWGDGLIRLLVLWLAMLGAVAASRDGRHIAIDVLSRVLPAGLARASGVAANAFATAVSGALAWYSWRFVSDSFRFGDTLLNELPAWMFQLILPVGFGLLAYRYAVRTLQRLRAR